MKRITVFILCEDESISKPFGKAAVMFQKRPFIEHIIEAIKPISSELVLITNAKDLEYLPYPKIVNVLANTGFIGGIYTALLNSKTKFNLIVSSAVPYISTELLLELISKHNQEAAVAIFETENKLNPLIGIYAKKLLPIIKKAIDSDALKVMDLILKNTHQIVTIPTDEKASSVMLKSDRELDDFESDHFSSF